MIVLGIVLLVCAYLLGISLLYTLGILLVAVGVVLVLLGAAGHPVGGRPYWW